MSKLLHLSKVILLGLSFTTSVLAYEVPLDENVSKKVAGISAEDCGPFLEARLEGGEQKNGAFNETLVLDFGDLAAIGAESQVIRSCVVKSRVKVKAGSKLRINEGAVIGYSDLGQAPAHAQAVVDFSYSMQASGDFTRASGVYRGQAFSDVNLVAKPENSRFTPCKNEDQEVELNGQILLRLTPGLDASSALRVTGGSQGAATGWNWGWGDCFKGDFQTQYTAYDGKTYSATIKLDGPTTTYHSTGGFVGQLFDLKRSGRVLTGKWDATGKKGYIEFRIDDFSTGAFRGEWGELDANNKRYKKGDWWGQLASSQANQTTYRLYNSWQGAGRVLATEPQGDAVLQSDSGNSRQRWVLEPTSDQRVKLKNLASGRCLDINADNYQTREGDCAQNYGGQFWSISLVKGTPFLRLKSKFGGDGLCLDVINDGRNNRLHLTACGNLSGQLWRVENTSSSKQDFWTGNAWGL